MGLVMRIFGVRLNILLPFPLLWEAGIAVCGSHHLLQLSDRETEAD